jgi:RNA polymerase sigma-70 factor, ECF subfamily
MRVDKLIKENLPVIKRYCSRYARSFKLNYDDLLGDTLERVWKKRSTFTYMENENSFNNWVRRIMLNICRDKHKARKTYVPLDYNLLFDPKPEAVDLLDKVFVASEKNLGLEDRQVFEMMYSGYRYNEISERISLSVGTIKSKVFYIRKKLTQAL